MTLQIPLQRPFSTSRLLLRREAAFEASVGLVGRGADNADKLLKNVGQNAIK
jgi:hypothetical protein